MNNRNKLLFENKEYSVEETVLKILQDSRAWKGTIEANKKQQVPLIVEPHQNLSNLHLVLLSSITGTNSWSVHTNAAWNSTFGNCGMGWHFKDTLATPAGTFSSTRRSVSSALVAEALALKAAISSAANCGIGIESLEVFSDSKGLITLLNTKKNNV
ncbi:uncharacterized protein LOC106363676 [Brassica napus]|uniref:uncharacterized protein LOC106363676 n=1 Tax=Brassica napus TaxID=3708 RepID=UPI0006AB6478|nr:uncharacterized protein LOC106363676 [Brassica napus]